MKYDLHADIQNGTLT